MAKGIVAFIIVVAFTLTISMLGGLGYYAQLGVSYNEDMDNDTQQAAQALAGQEATDQSGGSVLQDFTTSAGQTIASGWQVISNLSGVLKLLFNVPGVIAKTIQTFFMITFGLTFAAFIRGVTLQ